MATAIPTDVTPVGATWPTTPAPLIARGLSGKVQRRSVATDGRVFSLFYNFDLNVEADARWITRVQGLYHDGTLVTVAHPNINALRGAGGGTPLVNGASQTGSSIATDGWPASTTVLKGGDAVLFAGDTMVYMLRINATTDGTGAVNLQVSPPVRSGNSPADNAAITTTASVVFQCVIREIRIPAHDPSDYIQRVEVVYEETRGT